MSIKIYKDGKWQLFPGTGVGGSTNSYTKEESDNKYALKSDVTAVSGKVDDLEERIDQINTGGNCEDCISQSELESAISGVNSKIDNLVTVVSRKVDTGSYLFTLNGDQVNQGDSVNVTGSGASVIVDSAMDSNSENPVQNKVIYGAIQSLTNEVTTAFTLVNEKFTNLEGFRDNQYNKTIASGATQIKWKDVSSTSPLYLKTINGVSIIGNSEDNNITISGGSGTGSESKPSVIVFAYIQSNEKPTSIPNVTVDSQGNPIYTGEWKSISEMSDAISAKLQIWYSYATFVAGGDIVGSWSDPIPFAKDGLPGQDGTPGKDGIGVEYIYYRSNVSTIPSLPTNANSWEWDNVPENSEGWTNNPTGVDKDHQFEFVSVRTGNAANINPWSLPTLWSKYGVNGVDGDTIEYIYTLTADVTTQPSNPDNSWEYDNPQEPWNDNPQSVSETYKVCWVSVRKKRGNSETWEPWSTPAVWSKWSKDGEKFYSALVEVYKRSNSPIEATNKPGTFTWDFDKSNFAEGVSSNLNDYKLSIEGSGKYLYKCSAYLTSNSNIKLFNSEVWNGPYLVAQDGENGSGQSAVYLDLTNDSSYLVTDIAGKVQKEQVVNTTLRIYYGTTEQILTECTVAGNTHGETVQVDRDAVNKCANISITYPVSDTIISNTKLEYTIQAKATIGGDVVTKTIGFIVVISKPAESGKDAVMYNIVPSATVIKLDSTGENYIPSELSITVVKVEGAVSTNLSPEQITSEGLSLKYRFDNEDEISAPNWTFSFVKNSLDLVSSITFNLYKDTECIDTETVPVLRDGKNGDKGDKGDAGSNGYTQQVLQIYQRSTAELTAPDEDNYSVSELINNTWTAPGSWKKEIPPASSIPCFMSTAFIRFDASATNSTISVTWSAPVKILENGTGSDGRMLYPAGIWNSAASYTRTDTTTPFVLYQPTNGTPAYYVLIAESSGNIEPGTNADVWKLMESLDVAYANVMMVEMGTIGDATFYNNLMFSKNDASGNPVVGKGDTTSFTTINGTTTIKMNHSNKPTMAIDFNSGNAYFANGNIQLDKSGDVVVKNIIYDISETIKQEDIKSGQVGSFTYSFYPIKSINTYIDTGTLQATTGQNFDSFVFTFSNKNYEMCEFMEGVLINSGENQVHIVAGIYNEGSPIEEVKPTKFYYQGHENFAEIVLASHSILKYFYHPLNQESSSYSGELYIQGDNYTSFGSNPSAGILYIGNLSQSL